MFDDWNPGVTCPTSRTPATTHAFAAPRRRLGREQPRIGRSTSWRAARSPRGRTTRMNGQQQKGFGTEHTPNQRLHARAVTVLVAALALTLSACAPNGASSAPAATATFEPASAGPSAAGGEGSNVTVWTLSSTTKAGVGAYLVAEFDDWRGSSDRLRLQQGRARFQDERLRRDLFEDLAAAAPYCGRHRRRKRDHRQVGPGDVVRRDRTGHLQRRAPVLLRQRPWGRRHQWGRREPIVERGHPLALSLPGTRNRRPSRPSGGSGPLGRRAS